MIVKVKSMEMPKSCTECRFCVYINSGISLHCKIKQKEIPLKMNARSNECPLQEVKECESMEKLKEWVEGEIAIAEDQLKNTSSNDEYDRVEAKKFTLERVLDRINFYISKKD